MSDLSEITNKESKIIASSGKYVNSNLATPNGPQQVYRPMDGHISNTVENQKQQ